jgi:hypothetical protein
LKISNELRSLHAVYEAMLPDRGVQVARERKAAFSECGVVFLRIPISSAGSEVRKSNDVQAMHEKNDYVALLMFSKLV